MNKFDELKELIASLEGEFENFYKKGNSASGVRIRKAMQAIKDLAQQARIEIQDVKQSMQSEDDEAKGGGPRRKNKEKDGGLSA